MINTRSALAALTVLAASAPAPAAVTISTAATQNMSCSAGVCTPTADNAVLNAGDLESMLIEGNVTVATTGQNAQAQDIIVKSAVEWLNGNTLTFDAYRNVVIDASVQMAGAGGLTILTGDGGTTGAFSVAQKGHVSVSNLSSALAINGIQFTLVDTIALLAADIAAKPAGNYAFTKNYDARGDGTYTGPPINVVFSGLFEGLGNTISNLTIDDPAANGRVGLFGEVAGTVRDVRLSSASVTGGKSKSEGETVGTLMGLLDAGGEVLGSSATGSVSGGRGNFVYLGGLIGFSYGDVSFSHANVSVNDLGKNSDTFAGGLIGMSFNSVEQSFSEGPVRSAHGEGSFGGFVGENAEGTISNCYETGSVTVSNANAALGGFAGSMGDSTPINEAYSTGLVSGGSANLKGGFVGQIQVAYFDNDYWDVTTSEQSYGSGKGNVSGITGLTTIQLQSGLPTGFDPKIWTENPNINNGLPYLIVNSPPK